MQQITSDARQTTATLAVVDRFNEAFNRQDLDATMALMTGDCHFENTTPPPDGARHAGQVSVRAAFASFFRSSPGALFHTEARFALGDRCVVQWVYHWTGIDGAPGHVRGVDLFRVRDGKVAEKMSYVKG